MRLGSPLALYAPFQVRDALVRSFVAPILFLAIGGIPLLAMARSLTLEAMRTPGPEQDGAIQVYGQTMSLSMTLGALVLMGGIVALDRERQYFRFLFSAPVVPWRFYLQQFWISCALFILLFALVPLGFSAIIAPVPIIATLASAALYAFLIGSLALLCGALTERDGLALILSLVAATVLQQLDRLEQLPVWGSFLARSLPPLVALDAVRSRWLVESAADKGDLVLVLAYSIGMLVAALLMIRRAPLAR